MRVYLATVTIFDGQHEHSSYALIKATSQDEAWKIAQAEIEKQENEDLLSDEEGESKKGYWSYGDDSTQTELISVEELSNADAEVIRRLGFAFYLN